MKKIEEVLKNNINGLYYGSRILLPFGADILKAIIENDIVTDFSHSTKSAEYKIRDEYTEIYFHHYKNLDEFVNKYETIKLIVVEKGDDIFNFKNHKKIILRVKEKHIILIEEASSETIFLNNNFVQ